MIDKNDALYKDFDAVRKIPVVNNMLEVVCRLTGLGFAAIARVTEDRWLACTVRDEVNFGLEAGGELKIETTICNEIRDHQKPVVIDHVATDEKYKNHHTPKLYGLQSYISYPIILKNGTFFGTLCAIGTQPAILNDQKITGTFAMFAELIAFHLQSLDLMERSYFALKQTNVQLDYSNGENMLYQQITDHNVKEQLRKIALFSGILMDDTSSATNDKIKETALKINSFSRELTTMMDHISKFSSLNADAAFELTDLDGVLQNVCEQLHQKLSEKNIVIDRQTLNTISAVPEHMEQLFFHLINHAALFSKNNSTSVIKIYSKSIAAADINHPLPQGNKFKFLEIFIEHDGAEIEKYTIENIFDIFVHLDNKQSDGKYGAGLAYSRKIIHNHGGVITAQSMDGKGVSFRIILPVNYTPKAVTAL